MAFVAVKRYAPLQKGQRACGGRIPLATSETRRRRNSPLRKCNFPRERGDRKGVRIHLRYLRSRFPARIDTDPVKKGTAHMTWTILPGSERTIRMDEIERGFDLIFEQLEELNRGREGMAERILEGKARLLEKMAAKSAPVVARIGLSMVKRAKLDARGEPYNAEYYPAKMLVLGKTEPAKFRPDDVSRPVVDQFCVLSEEGKFHEIMYSSDPVFMDSYLNPLTTEEVLDIYGLDIMFMLYRAMRDYLEADRDLVEALGKVIVFVFGTPSYPIEKGKEEPAGG
jgi:hypothetical protein